ncbi:MAG: T9SS type A sorting domain-containing protein [Chitinophagaceae bacterium]
MYPYLSNRLFIIILLLVLADNNLTAQVPSGAVGRYTLNGNANDASGNGYNGSLSGTVNTTNRLGTTATALSFVAVTSSGTLPSTLVTAMQNDFSIGFWFRSAAIAPSGTQWFNGISLIDAETAGQTDDWGVCLIDGGKVCFGIGNPDITIKSTSATYNNAAWHFVTATRNKSAGTIILYVDGAQVATTTGTSTSALSAPSVLGLGRSSAVSTGTYTGTLDDIISYNRVLTPTEVSNMYSALTLQALPLRWVSFTGTVSQDNVLLHWETADEINNSYFTVESSGDAIHFDVLANTQAYDYTDRNKSGTWYYRIRQTDLDGKYSYSKTIRVDSKAQAGIYLQSNPASNQLTVVNPKQVMIKQITITDLSGRIINSKAINNSNNLLTISTINLPKGYYVLRADAKALPFVKQ